MFIHSGIWHFFANMLTLYFFGFYLSRLIGDSKLLIVYFGGGILGNILYIFLGNPLSIAVGVSGAVFALGGALAIMRPKLRVIVFPIPVPPGDVYNGETIIEQATYRILCSAEESEECCEIE